MRATIEDVARRASVSAATVSRALRGLPNVSPATRERVLAAARDLEYVGDPSASRLAGGPTRTVGFVVPSLGQWFYSRLFVGAEHAAMDHGFDTVPFSTAGPGGLARFVERLPFHKRVDGLVLADLPLGRAQYERLSSSGLPVLTVGIGIDGAPGLVIDNVAAARLAVNHLARLGHRRIGILGPAADSSDTPVLRDRYLGYQEGLEAVGLDVEPRLVAAGPSTLLGGAQAMQRLVATDEPPTAVFACSDEMAIGAMQVAADAGLRVPEDLSVVGFDDHDVAEYIGLTTIRQDVEGQGERIASSLIRRLAGEPCAVEVETHPTRLMVRRTTAPPLGGAGYRW